MKRSKFFLLLLFVLTLLIYACDPSTPNIGNNDEENGSETIPAISSGLTLILPQMSQEDIDNLQEVIIYDDGVELEHYYADTLGDYLRVVSSRSTSNLVSAEVDVELEVGNYNISAEGIGYKGNGFKLEETPVTVSNTGTPIRYTCEPDKTSYIYLECEAFIPHSKYGSAFITLTIDYGTYTKTESMNIWEAKFPLEIKAGTVKVNAELSAAAKEQGYSLEYDSTFEITEGEASRHRILVKNESLKTDGQKITFTYDREGRYNYFNSFSSWFPKSGIDTDNDEARDNNSFGFVVCYVPESMIQEIYAPADLNYGYLSSTWNYCTKAAERHEIARNSDSEWTISTSYASGETIWVNVTIDPLPQDLIDSLARISLNYGDSSIGGWSEEYIPSQFSPLKERTLEMTAKPGTFDFTATLRPKDGMTLAYDLVPDPKTLTTVAGYEYSVRYSVVEKDAVEDSGITDTPQTPSDTDTETANIIVSIGPLPQEMVDSLQRISLSYGKESLGGWSDEYIASNFGSNKVKTQTRAVTPGTQTVSASLTAKDGMELKYGLVPDISSLTTEAGCEYNVNYKAVAL